MNERPPNPPEKQRKNYYEILGVPSKATQEEIKAAFRRLALQHHPDQNRNNPEAEEKFKEINEANGVLSNKEKKMAYDLRVKNIVESPSRTHPTRERTEKSAPRPQRTREQEAEIEQELLFALRHYGPISLKLYAGKYRDYNTHQFIYSKKAQEFLREDFLTKIRFYSHSPEVIIRHINNWRSAGADLTPFLNLPEVQVILQGAALKEIKLYGESPSIFLNFIESWKNAGVNLRTVLELPEAKRYLADHAIEKIELSTSSPDIFMRFVEEWRGIGIELAEVVNSPQAQDILSQAALTNWRQIGGKIGKMLFEDLVRAWMQAG